MVKIQKTKANADENVEQEELCFVAGGNAKWDSHFEKTVGQFLTKINILLPYNPAVTLLSIDPKELNTIVHTKTCTQMFIAASFIIAETWKQPKCPSTRKTEYPNSGISRQWISFTA